MDRIGNAFVCAYMCDKYLTTSIVCSRWDGAFDVHQLSDADKQWTDPKAMAQAKQMAKGKHRQCITQIEQHSHEV